MRWLAAIGADYGVVVVRDDSTYKTLGALMDALKKDPAAVVFGTGGSVGSQIAAYFEFIQDSIVAKLSKKS